METFLTPYLVKPSMNLLTQCITRSLYNSWASCC